MGDANDSKAMPPQQKLAAGYDYLLSLPLWSITLEKVEELKRAAADKRAELDVLRATQPTQMWVKDLDAFVAALEEYEAFEKTEKELGTAQAKKLAAKAKKKAAPTLGRKKKADDDDEDFDTKKKKVTGPCYLVLRCEQNL
jgi:DNA topoisomerase-2